MKELYKLAMNMKKTLVTIQRDSYLSLAKTAFITLFPFVSYLETNLHILPIRDFLFFTITCWVIIFSILCLFCIICVKNKKQESFRRILFVFDIAFLIFFLFTPIVGFGKIIVGFFNLSRGATLVYAFIAIMALWFASFISKYKLPHVFLFIFSILVVSFNAIKITWLKIAPRKESVSIKTEINPFFDKNITITKKRNIYYIILDAYSAPPQLKDELGWDSNDFLQTLASLNFYHAKKAFASYNATYLTLASIFQMDYIAHENSPKYYNRSNLYPAILYKSEETNLIEIAKSLGYKFYLFGNTWNWCGQRITCIELDKKTLVPYYALLFLSNTPLLRLYEKYILPYIEDKEDKENLSHFAHLAKQNDAIGRALSYLRQVDITSQPPSFMFIHNLSPHSPYLWKQDCSIRDEAEIHMKVSTIPLKKHKRLYLESIQCVNKKIIEFARFIAKNDPEAIVIFQSDHGVGFKSLEMNYSVSSPEFSQSFELIQSRMAILNLLRVPSVCKQWLSSKMNNVNSIRLALACAIGTKPNLLENKSYMGTYETTNPDLGRIKRVQIPK